MKYCHSYLTVPNAAWFPYTNFMVVKKHDIHIKAKSYKFELLGELVI